MAGTVAGEADDVIGPTPIPFYTGNRSVGPFMVYFGTSKGPANDFVTDEHIALLKRIGVFADCDYQQWAIAEQTKGKWDFGIYAQNAKRLHAAGFKYIAYCWIHFPPKWFVDDPSFVPFQCAEHNEKLIQLSPWAPNVWELHRAYYAAQKRAMGEAIDWMRVSVPADYGEVGFPCGMTSWLVPQKHAHPGYWCGDPHARADFRAEMKRRFTDLATLNERWGTSFAAWDAVDLPPVAGEATAAIARRTNKATDRRRWLDFIEWYYGFWLRFTPKLTELIREFYPKTPLIVSVGYASENTAFGNDYSAIPKMAQQIDVALQTPGNVAYYAMKRVSTACHFYGTRYYTEPPGDVPPPAEMQRLFFDISNGVQVYFEYPQNLDRARSQIREYKVHMTGAKPVVDLAFFNCTVSHRLDCGRDGFPVQTLRVAEQGRERFDYDVVDELMVQDGALANYRVLVWVQGNVTEAAIVAKLKDWIAGGGTLLTCDLAVQSVEGDGAAWQELMPAEKPTIDELRPGGRFNWAAVAKRCTKRVGKGLVVRIPIGGDRTDVLIEATEHVCHHLRELAPGLKSAALIDGETDGVLATRLPDRLLYFNPNDQERVKVVTLRAEDWADTARKPAPLKHELRIPAHGLTAIPLH
jgi:hypothetical protein